MRVPLRVESFNLIMLSESISALDNISELKNKLEESLLVIFISRG